MSHKRLSHLLLLAGGIAGVGALGVLIDYARMLAFRALERPEMALRYWGLLVFLCLVAARRCISICASAAGLARTNPSAAKTWAVCGPSPA